MGSRAADRALRWAGLAAVTLSALVVVLIVGAIAVRGIGGLDWRFLTGADSVQADGVGIWGALKGSLLTIAVTLGLSLPLGVASAVWLEEFAPIGRWTTTIEVLIANLAAVPPILFGLLGLAVFVNAWSLPRSAPIVAGLTLTLMTLPVIVIAARGALRAVSRDVRDAARGIGASPLQVAVHHVLPLAAPGIITGTLLGTARALGEVAPLLLIGMRAFIAAPPRDLESPATVLPMQVFLWSDRLGHGFVQRTAAASLILLTVLFALGVSATLLRDRWERRR